LHCANPFYFYLNPFNLKRIIFIIFIICSAKLCASNLHESLTVYAIEGNEVKSFVNNNATFKKPNPIWFSLKKKRKNRKKVIAVVLAFPLPFGVIGLHRIYLGTKPYVPLVYMGTIGGAFGILPFIDFCVLLLDKDTEHYKENSHIFMWIENKNKKKETKTTHD
jgi:TM2 domain-containing membrane protein YozV